jgi:signal transduction histidine kinase
VPRDREIPVYNGAVPGHKRLSPNPTSPSPGLRVSSSHVLSARVTSYARMALLAATYVALAKLGLHVATVGRSVTLVWPPAGLALAALLLGSRRLWPGVALGAFVANFTTPGVGLLTASVIASGNTLAAVVGATLVRRRPFRAQLDRTVDVVRLAALGAAAGPLASASIGSLALFATGLIQARALPGTWRVWWVGDAIGALVVAPALLTWLSRAGDTERRRPWEAPALAAALVVAALGTLIEPHPTRPYLVFPPLIWAALRFGPRGATAATLVISVVTVWSTVVGHGAFVVSSLGDNLMALDAFMASVALTSLILGATAAERARAIEAREHFISIASHELRTPLAPLRLQVQRLLRGMRRAPGTLAPETVVDALVVVDRQVERLSALLENVLDLTRLRLGRLPLRPEEVDAGVVVDEVATTLRDSLTHAGCSLRVERRGAAVGIWDRARLAQVVTNLLSNAMKHGGACAIDVVVEGGAERATIVVRDHGPGVPASERERIFGRFEHAGAHGENAVAGLGLGLYIAREIVEAHGGLLTVESPAGGGAAFKLDLPLRPAVS